MSASDLRSRSASFPAASCSAAASYSAASARFEEAFGSGFGVSVFGALSVLVPLSELVDVELLDAELLLVLEPLPLLFALP